MLHPTLQQRLRELGVSLDHPPADPHHWLSLLERINSDYFALDQTEGHQTASESSNNSVHHHVQELELMSKVRSALSNKIDLKETIQTIVETTAETFNYNLVSVYLLEKDVLHLQHQIGYYQVVEELPTNRGIMGRVARTGQPAYISNVNNDPDYIAALPNLVSEICVPLLYNDSVVGVLNVESSDDRVLTPDDFNLMVSLSEHISIAIERARLYTVVRESREKYRAVVDNIHEGIFQLDMNGYCTFANYAWATMSGYTFKEVIGKKWTAFIPPDEATINIEVTRGLVKGEYRDRRYQTAYLRKDGARVPAEVHIQLVQDDLQKPLGFIGTVHDITDQVAAEQREMELKLKARTVEALKHFLSGVSHDLRTPLSVINTTAYLLRRKLPQLADETRYLNTLDEQVAHLTRTLQDMLDMSHLDDDIVEFNFRRLNLNGLVRDVLTGLKSEADEKRHSMIFIADPDTKQIMADQVMMGRVITHLIQNAIFYTPSGGSITVRTSYRDDRVILQVQDNGIGIDASEIPNIFDRFYKIDQARPVQNSGTGLGLSIVKKIVEAHNGTIHVISTPGKGSTFSVSLPTSSITTTREVAIIQPTTDYGVDYGF